MTKFPIKIVAIVIGAIVLVAVVAAIFMSKGNNTEGPAPTPTKKPEPINVIPLEDRPYVTLKPLVGRNQLQITIHDLKIPADAVEVTLEYDRNEGVMDAVLREFDIQKLPLIQDLFMGSKSAGGHITFHDDVIGGTLHLEFEGDDPYALENPWRYDDKLTMYSELSTADGKFQVELDEAYRTAKIIVMQSPGLPIDAPGEVIAGPYLFRGVIPLPTTTAVIKVRLPEEAPNARFFGFDGEEWQRIEAEVDGKTLTATSDIYETYIVVQ